MGGGLGANHSQGGSPGFWVSVFRGEEMLYREEPFRKQWPSVCESFLSCSTPPRRLSVPEPHRALCSAPAIMPAAPGPCKRVPPPRPGPTVTIVAEWRASLLLSASPRDLFTRELPCRPLWVECGPLRAPPGVVSGTGRQGWGWGSDLGRKPAGWPSALAQSAMPSGVLPSAWSASRRSRSHFT